MGKKFKMMLKYKIKVEHRTTILCGTDQGVRYSLRCVMGLKSLLPMLFLPVQETLLPFERHSIAPRRIGGWGPCRRRWRLSRRMRLGILFLCPKERELLVASRYTRKSQQYQYQKKKGKSSRLAWWHRVFHNRRGLTMMSYSVQW